MQQSRRGGARETGCVPALAISCRARDTGHTQLHPPDGEVASHPEQGGLSAHRTEWARLSLGQCQMRKVPRPCTLT